MRERAPVGVGCMQRWEVSNQQHTSLFANRRLADFGTDYRVLLYHQLALRKEIN